MNEIDFRPYLSCDYQCYEHFADNVLKPIFADNYSSLAEDEDFISTVAEQRLQAKEDIEKTLGRANIKQIIRKATIEPIDAHLFNKIDVYDITIADNCKLSQSRVGIRQFIKSNSESFSHALMVFHYESPVGHSWRFSYLYKDTTTTTSAKRFTYLFGSERPSRTANERFNVLRNDMCNKCVADEDIIKAFSVEALSDEFFFKYLGYYASFVKFITGRATSKEEGEHCITRQEFKNVITRLDAYGKADENQQYSTYFRPRFASGDDCDKAVRDYVKKILGRIVFLHFLQHKGWLCNDRNFMQHLFERSVHKDDFLDRVLEPLFFAVLNTKPEERINVCHRHNEKVGTDPNIVQWDEQQLQQWNDIPYLNGGLFEQESIDVCRSIFPKEYFADLLEFFSQYNFTIDENDPDDAEVGVDPEMLSKIFESLLEDNKDKGAFYTPKEIVRYMCQESLIAYLVTHRPELKDDIEQLVRNNILTDKLQGDTSKAIAINNLLMNVRICDPAIGSGAFPMGLLNIIFACRRSLHELTDMVSDNTNEQIKRCIIQNNIYGVDIEQGAVDIARLRFWLALVVDAKEPQPLPNLDYKIMKGNSLISTFNGEFIDLSGKTKKGNHVRIDESSIVADKIHLSNRQQEFFQLCGDEKYKEEITIKNLILDIIEKQLGYDRKAYLNNNAIQYNLWNESTTTTVKLPTYIINSIATLEELRSRLNDETLSLHERASINMQFFDWNIMFANVFDNGGFDIVIGNPPYFVYEGFHKEEISQLKRCKEFETALGGKLNAYKLFLAKSVNVVENKSLAKANGIIAFIFQNSFLADKQAIGIRKDILENNQIICIDSFPERDSIKKRVFESAKMSVCILLAKHSNTDEPFTVNIWNDKNKTSGITTSFTFSDIKAIDPETLSIPRIKQENLPLVVKMNNTQNKIYLHCYQGELNVTVHKKYFTTNESDPKVLKGASIQRYFWTEDMSQGNVEYVNEVEYLKAFPKSEKAKHHTLHRIAMQGMTGANDNIRIVATLIPSNLYLAHSCNYIIEETELSLKYCLGIINSKIFNWYFRCFSTNSNVNSYEIETIPIPVSSVKQQQSIITLVDSILSAKKSNSQTDTKAEEYAIDYLAYKLYGLTYDEVKIVDPQTDITEEEYNK